MTDPVELQSIMVTNRISAFAIVFVLVIGTMLGMRQWNAEPIFVLSLSLAFCLIPALIYWQYFNTARLLLCIVLPVIVVCMSVISKRIPGEEVTESEYFDYRYVLIAISIVPPIVFGFARKRLLAISIIPYFIAFVIFDPLHNLLNVGYYQIEHVLPSYNVSQWIATIMFCVIIAGVLILRRTSDEIQSKNQFLLTSLNKVNLLLKAQTVEIEKAHDKIKQQNEVLNSTNKKLESKVVVTNQELLEANVELIKHNNELQQFSYTVSHNLRGPVASILGLVNLMIAQEPKDVKDPIIIHLKKSAKILDSTISDLGMIIDIRNDIFKIRQLVIIHDILEEIITPFKKDIIERKIQVEYDLRTGELYTIKPMLVSILYNLFSNALKYSAVGRPSSIKISTSETRDEFQLEVSDNGIGIDLEIYAPDLFKLYKRFHTHTEGKGIGLYLVKQQVKSLGGKIEVASELDSFTRFTILLPKPSKVDHQVLLNEQYAEIYFDAPRNLIAVEWRRGVSGKEYCLVLNRCLEFMKEYSAAHWLMDTRKRGDIGPEEQNWLVEHLLPEAFKLGLKRLVVVYTGDIGATARTFYERNKDVFMKHDIEVSLTTSFEDANDWLDKRKIAR